LAKNRHQQMSEVAVAIVPEIQPPPAGRKPSKKRAASGQPPRPPARPYRKIDAEVLASRIARLTTRIEKTKRQHESTRVLLTKYAHEKFYREKEAIEEQNQPPLPSIAPLEE
jgi:ribosomal protein S15P/S13E